MNRILPFFFIALIILVSLFEAAYAQPYVRAFNANDNKPVSTVSELNNAIATSQPGHSIEIAGGIYNTGQIILSRAGTAENAIVMKPVAGEHVVINGSIRMNAAHNYIMGLEITGGANVGGVNLIGVEMFCNNCGAINNVIHGINGAPGLMAYNTGANQVIYGNIFYENIPANNNPHNLYVQNDYNTFGYKYIVGNASIDSNIADTLPNGSAAETFNFHAYTQGGFIDGMYVEKNVFSNGRFLIGRDSASAPPQHHQVVKGNYFYNLTPQIGYRNAIQFEFTNNYIGRGGFKSDWIDSATSAAPNIFTGNKLVTFSGQQMAIKTAIGGTVGTARIKATDIFDDNQYSGPWRSSLNADGVFHCCDTSYSGHWLPNTAARGGVNWDVNSTYSASTASSLEYFVIENEYDSNRAFLVVYNWPNATSFTFNRAGQFALYNLKDSFGAAIISGVDSASVPLTKEFEVFLIKGGSQPEPEPECDPDLILQLATDIWNIRMDQNANHAQRVRRMGRKDLELLQQAEICAED